MRLGPQTRPGNGHPDSRACPARTGAARRRRTVRRWPWRGTGRPGPGPGQDAYRGSVNNRCCFSENKLSTGVSSSVTRCSTPGRTSRGGVASGGGKRGNGHDSSPEKGKHRDRPSDLGVGLEITLRHSTKKSNESRLPGPEKSGPSPAAEVLGMILRNSLFLDPPKLGMPNNQDSWWSRPCGGTRGAGHRAAAVHLHRHLVGDDVHRPHVPLWYSSNMIAAAMAGGMLYWTMICFPVGVAGYVNTFVAQYFGAERPERIGAATWQGMWIGVYATPLVPGGDSAGAVRLPLGGTRSAGRSLRNRLLSGPAVSARRPP